MFDEPNYGIGQKHYDTRNSQDQHQTENEESIPHLYMNPADENVPATLRPEDPVTGPSATDKA